MDYLTVLVYLLFSIILSALVIAVIAYIKHWAKRESCPNEDAAITQGYYFKRYIPPSLYHKFDPDSLPIGDKSIRRIRLIERALITFTVLIGSLLIILPMYTNMDEYLHRESVNNSEKVDVNSVASKKIKLEELEVTHVGGRE